MFPCAVLKARNEGGSVLAAPPPMTCGSCRMQVPRTAVKAGVVDLDPAGKEASLFPVRHHPHELVLAQPGSGEGHAQRRVGSRVETLFLACVIRCMAGNQVGSGSLLDSKTVPLTTLHR